MIPYGRQEISEDDIEAVVQVLRSDFITQGPAIPRFEQAVATYCGAAHAIAVSSGTAALHLACLATGLGPGDRLWTTPNTFVASANCGRYCGADVDFVDIDRRTLNMSVEALATKLEAAAAAATLPKVVVPVDFAGEPGDLAAIRRLADQYGFTVIEDASHAIGARYRGEPIGSGGYADMTVFSFHPVKIITTAEGGMVVTDDPTLAGKVSRLRSHGITRDQPEMAWESDGEWYYHQLELGFNYRMTDLQAGLGHSQLRRIDRFLARRQEVAARYDELLGGLPIVLPYRSPESRSALHLYVIQLDPARTDRTRGEVFESLRAAGIGVNVHYIPVHLQPYYRRLGFKPGDFPNAESYYQGAISLPIYPGLTPELQDRVVAALAEALQ